MFDFFSIIRSAVGWSGNPHPIPNWYCPSTKCLRNIKVLRNFEFRKLHVYHNI